MAAEPPEDFPVEESMPEASVPLDSILCTEELRSRPSRPPDYEKENRALVEARRPHRTRPVPQQPESGRPLFASAADGFAVAFANV